MNVNHGQEEGHRQCHGRHGTADRSVLTSTIIISSAAAFSASSLSNASWIDDVPQAYVGKSSDPEAMSFGYVISM